MAEGKKRTRGMDTRLFLFYAGCAIFNIGSNTAHPVTPTIFTTLGLGSYMFGLALAAQLTTNPVLAVLGLAQHVHFQPAGASYYLRGVRPRADFIWPV